MHIGIQCGPPLFPVFPCQFHTIKSGTYIYTIYIILLCVQQFSFVFVFGPRLASNIRQGLVLLILYSRCARDRPQNSFQYKSPCLYGERSLLYIFNTIIYTINDTITLCAIVLQCRTTISIRYPI